MNIHNRLKTLFYAHLNRLSEEKKTSYNCHRYREQNNNNSNIDNTIIKGVLYFYEWSDVNRMPKMFYFMRTFEEFLKRSNIPLQGYEREIIRNLTNPYVACKKDSKELVIKGTYALLKQAMEHDGLPYSVQCTYPPQKSKEEDEVRVLSCKIYPQGSNSGIQRPPMYKESNNRLEEQEDLAGVFQF